MFGLPYPGSGIDAKQAISRMSAWGILAILVIIVAGVTYLSMYPLPPPPR